MLCLLLTPTLACAANPVVPTGGSAALTATGMDYPATSLTWDIIRPGTTVTTIATSAAPNGWAATQDWGSGILAVSVPTGAAPATGLEVRFRASGAFGSPPPIHRSAFFDVTAATGLPRVSSLSITPTSIQAWRSATGTVTLTAAAPTGGTTVLLSNTVGENVATPASSYVVVPQGATSTTFVAQSNNNVASSTAITFRADVGGSSATSVLTVTPIVVVSLTFDVLSIKANGTATGTVTLNGAAGSDPTVPSVLLVQLSSDSTGVSVPAGVSIPVGSSTKTFTVTGNNPLSATTANITASYNNSSYTASLSVYPSIGLTAVSTGSGKLTLYWDGLTNATGYNVYRGTASGGPYTKVNAAPVAFVDPGPVSNVYMFSDTGLANGTLYYYYVAGLSSAGQQLGRSNEDYAVPDANAIPWDTGNANSIISQFRSLDTAIRQDEEVDADEFTVVGPDGVVYRSMLGQAATATAPDGYTNRATNVIEYSDGTTIARPLDSSGSYSVATGPYQGYTRTNPPTGIFRKVESVLGQTGMRAIITIPSPQSATLLTGDSAWIYVGGYVNNQPGIDSGLQLASSTNVGWTLAFRGQEFRFRDPAVKGKLQVRAGDTLISYVVPGFSHGNFTVPNNVCVMAFQGNIYNVDTRTDLPGHRIAIGFIVPHWLRTSSIRLKRVNSLAQAEERIRASGREQQGYVVTNSFINGAAWGTDNDPFDDVGDGYVRLFPSGVYWDDSLTYNQGAFPGGSGTSQQVSWLDTHGYWLEFNINLKLNP